MIYRGRHRANKFSVRVADLQAQIADEWISTGRKFGNWDVVWNNGKEYYQWEVECIRWMDPAPGGGAVMLIKAPEAAEGIEHLHRWPDHMHEDPDDS